MSRRGDTTPASPARPAEPAHRHAAALLGALLSSCAAQSPPAQPTDPLADSAPLASLRRPIVTGELAVGHPAVVAIGGRRTDCEDRLSPHCSGTLIAPQVVLTAAHCVAGTPWGDDLEVLFGRAVSDPEARVVRVQRTEVHPTYRPKGANPATGTDLALLILEAPIDAADVRPATLDRAGQVAPQIGDRATMVGFGSTGPLGEAPGRKRSGTARVTRIDDAGFRLVGDPAVSCHGDSGGPVWVSASGTDLLVGVMTSGDPGCQKYSDAVRLDAWLLTFPDPARTPEPPSPAATEALAESDAALCEAACSAEAPCAAALRCRDSSVPAGVAPRCLLPGLLPGTFGATCSANSQCGADSERCARLLPGGGDGACRCYRPCALPPAPGCSLATRPGREVPHALTTPFAALIASLLGLLGLLGARRSRSPAGSNHRGS